ncbi:AAA family ATPase, partial [Desulfothermus okinawensis]
GVESCARENFRKAQEALGIQCENREDMAACFSELIDRATKKYNQKVVILIDEYDKPILDVIEDRDQAKENREYLRGLYSIIKDNDAYVRFAFLTGVSKFSKASIFSGLNMLEDISLSPRFGNICGYTQKDIETTFLPYLEGVDLNRVTDWYNGYYFLKERLYNPFDILQFIKNDCIFDNYWFETGTPTFLIKLIKQNRYFLPRLSDMVVDKKILSSFDVENIDLEVILYQSGYLTIDSIRQKRRGDIEYRLRLPNEEVKISLNDYIIDYLFEQRQIRIKAQNDLYDALMDEEIDKLQKTLVSLFASIPYNYFTKNKIDEYEGFYASVVYVYLQSLGFEIIGEDVTNHGRIDLTVLLDDKIYIIEFKVDGKKGEALSQIKQKRYHEKYLDRSDKIYLIGIEFSSKDRNVLNFEWEKIN